MVVRHDIAQRDAVFDHQIGRQSSRAIHNCIQIATALLAHFNADAVSIPRTVKVCVFTLLIGRHVLHGYFVIDGEMPDQIADPIAASAFWRAQGSVF
jgi:hypothetical protein